MMEHKNPFRSSTLWLGLALWLGFIPFVYLLPRQELFEILNSIVFAISIGIVVSYAPGVWQGLRSPIEWLRSGDALQIGIAIGWLATGIVFGSLWLWRLTGKNDLFVDHGINAWSRWVLCTAGFMHLAAAGSIDGRVPTRAYLRAGILTAVGIIMGTIVITYFYPLPINF
jgi:hypothetical protein